MKKLYLTLFFIPCSLAWAQTATKPQPDSNRLSPLTVEKIMRDSKWIGTSPSDVFWSPTGEKVYFYWNPVQADTDSLYYISLKNHQPQKAGFKEQKVAVAEQSGAWNNRHSQLVYILDQGIYLLDIKTKKTSRLFQSAHPLSNANFAFGDSALVYQDDGNLYSIDLHSGATTQLTDFKKGEKKEEKPLSQQASFLKNDALENSLILRQQHEKELLQQKQDAKHPVSVLPKTINIGEQNLTFLTLSPDGNYVFYELENDADFSATMVPNYVTTSGYTEGMKGRPVVGSPQPIFSSYIYDRKKDTVYQIVTKDIPGIRDIPAFIKKNYPKEEAAMKADTNIRATFISYPFWNETGSRAFVVVQAQDHKDRWIMSLNPATGKLNQLDRQHDDAWTGGPGIGYPYEIGNAGWINENTIWYQSEATGYSHLYTMNVATGEKQHLLKEIMKCKLPNFRRIRIHSISRPTK